MKYVLTVLALIGVLSAPARAEMVSPIMAEDAQIKLGIGERPAAMFVTLHNKGAATRLIGATSDAFARIELHSHEMGGGMMRMVKVDDFAVPANGMLTLKPGGYHLMLFDFNADADAPVQVTLQFANGQTVETMATPSVRQKRMPHGGMHGH